MRFYDIDVEYTNFLQKHDNQIPNIQYSSHNKFVCGIVISVNGIDYYAPVSSQTKVQRTSFPILDKNNNVMATIRFCFMFPAPNFVLTEKNFAEISKSDKSYADFILEEYNFCKTHKEDILQKAKSVYDIGCNKNHRLNYTCCDFVLLESVYKQYEVSTKSFIYE